MMDKEKDKSNYKLLAKILRELKLANYVKIWKQRAKQSFTRYKIVEQLAITQANYNKDLKLLQEKIKIPLRQNNIINQIQQQQMFPNIQGMIDLSNQLLIDVEKFKNTWNHRQTLIGPTMIRYSRFLQIYSQFLKAYNKTKKKLLNLRQRQDVRQIQINIIPYKQNQFGIRITQSFENLLSKPHQRPMKYQLLLATYLRQLKNNRNHPDYKNIETAIDCYKEINQRNNLSIEHQQKSQSLVNLEAKFSQIIDDQAKYYINQVQAYLIDSKVKCYILSTMLLISTFDNGIEEQLMRMRFDENSFIYAYKDGIYFKNRLYICGKAQSIHLTFKDRQTRNLCKKQIQGLINQLYKSYYTRKQLASSLRSTRSTYTRDSLVEVRRSYTQLPKKLPKPPRFLVLNQIKRRYGCSKTFKIYFIIKFILPNGQNNCQYIYIDYDELISLQLIIRNLYKQQLQNISMIQQSSKNMSSTDMKINSVKSLEYKSIYATIFINYLFRHPQIVKRTELIANKLRIHQIYWIYCKYQDHLKCRCYYCSEGKVILDIQTYNQQSHERVRQRQTTYNSFYCPFRTIHAQNMLAQVDISLVKTGIDRLLLLKCQKGHLDYTVVDSTPNYRFQRNINIKMQKIDTIRNLQIRINRHQTVGQIIDNCGKIYKLRLQDYQLFLNVNKNNYILDRDEILWTVLQNETTVGQNIFTFFKSAFGQKQDLTFHLYLKKVWVLQNIYQKNNYILDQQLRLGFIIQEFIVRLKKQQIKLGIEDTSTFYACYYTYLKLAEDNINITEEQLKSMIAHKKWKAMEMQHRTQMLEIVRQKIKHLKGKFTQAQILRNIWNYTIKMGQNCPGWSAYYFDAIVVNHPQYEQGFKVQIGADLNKLYIKKSQEMITILQMSLQQARNQTIFSSWQLHLITSSYTYIFTGDSLFHLQEIIDTYLLYKEIQKR